jgi:hypothetical protein
MYFAILFRVLRVEVALILVWPTVDEVPSCLVGNTSGVIAAAEVEIVSTVSVKRAVRASSPVHVVVPGSAGREIGSVIPVDLIVPGVSACVIGPPASQ